MLETERMRTLHAQGLDVAPTFLTSMHTVHAERHALVVELANEDNVRLNEVPDNALRGMAAKDPVEACLACVSIRAT